MSYTIKPNKSLGLGYIVTIVKTWKDGDQTIEEQIPCRNRATARFEANRYIKLNTATRS